MELDQLGQPYRIAFDSSPGGMAFVTPDWRFVEVNKAVCKMLGRTEAELKSQSAGDFTHPDDQPMVQAGIDRLLSGEIDDYQVEARYLHVDGRVGWAFVHYGVVRDSDGSVALFIAATEDITARRQMREIHDRLLGLVLVGKGPQALADTLSELIHCSIVLLDGNGELLAEAEGYDSFAIPSRQDLKSQMNGAPLPGLKIHPLEFGGEVEGYLVAVDRPGAGELTAMAIEQAASSFAFQLAMTRTAEEVEHRLRGDLFDAMLGERPPDPASATRWARRLGHDLASFKFLAFVRPLTSANDAIEVTTHLARLARIGANVVRTAAGGSIAVQRTDGVLIALTVTSSSQARDLLKMVIDRIILLSDLQVVAGLSSPITRHGGIPAAFREATQAAEVAAALPRLGPVTAANDFDLQHLVLSQKPSEELLVAARRTLAPLVDGLDAARSERLITTLRTFFESLGALETTAHRLGIHVNTLRYRLDQVEGALDLSLADARNRMTLQLALTVLELGTARVGPETPAG